jgi:PAS domain S-box-containing protein/putative nucleotidyltransferase with HDIG domain
LIILITPIFDKNVYINIYLWVYTEISVFNLKKGFMTNQLGPEQSATQSENRYRRLFESAQDGILILDSNFGVIQDANPFITNLLGFTRDELIGKELWEIGVLSDKSASLKAFTALKEKGYMRYEDLPLKRKDGQVINVEFISNIYKVNGDVVIQCNIRDISDRKKLEKELNEYKEWVQKSTNEMIDALANVIVARDPYTGGHQRRVASLAVAIATEMNLPLNVIEGVKMAALVHDIGKVAIPMEVLTKPIALTNFEVAMLRTHAQVGYEMIKHIHFPWNIAQALLQHHERLDGSGYPGGIKGDEICREARILAVADTIEAMSSDRPYRKGQGLSAALDEIAIGRGVIYDKDVVDACLKVFREGSYQFPPLV